MILVVVAHPDDESFFMGGTIAQMVQGGCSVTVAALSDGEGSRMPHSVMIPNASDFVAAKAKRLRQFKKAGKELGANVVQRYVFPDQQSDDVPQLEINREVERLLLQFRPSTVYTHHVGDLNLDHRRVAEAVLVATRGRCPVFSMSPEWPSRCVGPKWDPTVLRDIWDVIGTKARACLCYTDEIRAYPHPRSEQAVRAQHYEQFMEIQ